MGKYLMALDQGTTSSRCILFDRAGKICSMAQKEFTQLYPQSGWIEHDPREIWSSQLSVATEAMAKVGADANDIVGIGITNQRETTILWDKETGEPVYNAIVWQCRRTAPIIDKLVADGYADMIRKKTGLVPDPYFSGSKIAWILDNVPGVRERAETGEILFGTVDSWLIYNLTKGKVHATDYTNASRTMIFDIHTLRWDDELLNLLNIPKCILPSVHASSHIFGLTDSAVMGGEIPIAGVAGDQQAALFGQCCFNKGDVKNTYGTGCFLLMNTGTEPVESTNGLITTIAASTENRIEYALEGSVFVAGAAIQWLRDGLRMIDTAPESQNLARQVRGTDGVYLVPAFTGLGAPYWNPYARGVMVGLTRACSKEQFVRATLESLAYQTYDVLAVMEEEANVRISTLKVDGGASANNLLMQFQADILDAKVLRPECIETTALGAAYLAGLAVGFYLNREEIMDNWKLSGTFSGMLPEYDRKSLLKGWKRAVRCALAWADDRE